MSSFGRGYGGLKVRPSVMLMAAIIFGATSLAGCWTPPRIPDRAPDKPGVIAQAVPAVTTRTDLVVQAVDPVRHEITLLDSQDRTTVTYGVDPKIERAAAAHLNQRVKVTLVAQLTV